MSDEPDADGRVPETAPPVGAFRSSWRFGRLGPRPILLSLLAAVVAVTSGWWYVDRPAHRPVDGSGPVSSWAAPASSDETEQVMTSLAHHATALLDRDRGSYDQGLDTAAVSAGFGATQRAVFDNVAQLPLTTWRYVLDSPVTSPDVLVPAAARLGGRVVVVHVKLVYGLRAVDPQPTSKDQWLTAVDRSGSWLLAGDSDAAGQGGPSWRGPWDFGPLSVVNGSHTLVIGHPDRAGELAGFGALVDAAVPVVDSVWGSGWNQQVAVLIPDSTQEFAAVTADTGNTSDVAAVSVADEVQPDGTVLGARIVLNPATLGQLDGPGRRLVIQHELTHIATRAATVDAMPTWVIEGFADYVGNLGSSQRVPAIAAELAAEVRRGVVPTALPADSEFDGGNARLSQVYEESWLACRLIAARAGQQGLVRFYRAVGTAARVNADTAAAAGLRSILGLSVPVFTAAWRADLIRQLR